MIEYKDVVVPIGIEVNPQLMTRGKAEGVLQQIDGTILSALQRYGNDGWEAEGPTDAETLHRQNKFKVQSKISFMQVMFGGPGKQVWESVTIRLKRRKA